MSKYLSILCLFTASFLGMANSYSQTDWQVIHATQDGNLSIQLQLKEQINPTQEEWISLAIKNDGPTTSIIEKAIYQIQLSAYEGGSKDALKEVFLEVKNPLDFLGQDKAPIEYSGQYLLPSQNQNQASISAKLAALLGYPKDKPWTIKAEFSLQLNIQDAPESQSHWSAITFFFQWYPPSQAAQRAAWEQVRPLLFIPQSNAYQEERMAVLLNNPLAKKNLEPSQIIKAIQLRKGQNDGRQALIQYLDKNHPQAEQLIAFYRKRLFKKDFRALTDLSHAPNIWSDQFLEPIISWFQQGNSGVMIQIMDMMEVHRKDWIKKLGISTIFFDLIIYRYEDIIYQTHPALSDRELLVWSSAARLLAQTEHPEAEAIFRRFLSCKFKIQHKNFCLLPYSMELPPPLRVADVALEGLLQMNNQQLEELYFSAGYHPPYAAGEAEKVINRVRDGLILQLSFSETE